jgi:hypothetical protein
MSFEVFSNPYLSDFYYQLLTPDSARNVLAYTGRQEMSDFYLSDSASSVATNNDKVWYTQDGVQHGC